MTPTDEAIVREATSWIGTRWVHGQRVKHEGTDCVGFIIELGKAFGWIPADYAPPIYSRQHALHRDSSLLLAELARFAREVPPEERRGNDLAVGDIIAFHYERTAGHAGMYIGEGVFVHAYLPRRSVIASPLADFAAELHSVWRPIKRR